MYGKVPQSVSLLLDYYNRELVGKLKGIKRVLKERGLWPERGLVLGCPTTHNRPGCTRWLLRSPSSWGRTGSRRWAAECFFTLSVIVSLISAGAEQNVGSTLKQ